MVKNIVNSPVLQNVFYNLMAVLFVGGIIAMIILKVAFQLQEIDLAIAFIVAVIAVFTFLYNA